MKQIRDLHQEMPPGAARRVVADNSVLKQRRPPADQDHQRLEEHLQTLALPTAASLSSKFSSLMGQASREGTATTRAHSGCVGSGHREDRGERIGPGDHGRAAQRSLPVGFLPTTEERDVISAREI
ncbi:hypothetical protein [Nonomuraea aurantiaca]|uniref:hypothetical protein n=1 Tax=Nonomuraea aurantiaca TaxID=2878562 RepID=UPI001CD91AE4|nr:hypothetical protein [Nonomuraea aurantiaca]MCA2229584.1 hypothetical protein [Nonomuraea aurantiaca]